MSSSEGRFKNPGAKEELGMYCESALHTAIMTSFPVNKNKQNYKTW